MRGEPSIWCPKCRWRPRAEDRWVCVPGCGTSWNTFWTHAVCPGCSHQWQHTQCLACHALSLHKDWYHWPDESRLARRSRRQREHAGET